MKRTIREGVTRLGRFFGLSVLIIGGSLFFTGCESMMPGHSQQTYQWAPTMEVPAGMRPRNNNETSPWGASPAARDIERNCGVSE